MPAKPLTPDQRARKNELARQRNADRRKNDPAWVERERQRYREYYRQNLSTEAARSGEYYGRNKKRIKGYKREYWLKTRYGISRAEYDAMLDRQGGACAICHGLNNGHELAVDHCHDTGAIRGLLCNNCNVAIGHFRHDTSLLRGAIEYLQRQQ